MHTRVSAKVQAVEVACDARRFTIFWMPVGMTSRNAMCLSKSSYLRLRPSALSFAQRTNTGQSSCTYHSSAALKHTQSPLCPSESSTSTSSCSSSSSHSQLRTQRRHFARMPRIRRRDPFDPALRHDPDDKPDANYQLLRDPRPQGKCLVRVHSWIDDWTLAHSKLVASGHSFFFFLWEEGCKNIFENSRGH